MKPEEKIFPSRGEILLSHKSIALTTEILGGLRVCIMYSSPCIAYIRACERLVIPLDRKCSAGRFYPLLSALLLLDTAIRSILGEETPNLVTLK